MLESFSFVFTYFCDDIAPLEYGTVYVAIWQFASCIFRVETKLLE